MTPLQLRCRASGEMSHISLSGDRLEIKVLIIHCGLLPGNRPPPTELVCWLKRSKDVKTVAGRMQSVGEREQNCRTH